MNLSEVEGLLAPTPLPLETGYERLPDGVLHVAVRTDMHGCTGEMFEWWFRWRCDTQKYVWWHPVDHVSSEWQGDLRPDTHVGSEHVVSERVTGLPAQDLVIQFREPSEFFGPDRTPDGEILGGRLLHVGRDTEWGLALRSHFYIGTDLPALGFTPDDLRAVVPDELGPAVLQHGYDEFTFLSRFLPSLHIAEHRDASTPRAPW